MAVRQRMRDFDHHATCVHQACNFAGEPSNSRLYSSNHGSDVPRFHVFSLFRIYRILHLQISIEKKVESTNSAHCSVLQFGWPGYTHMQRAMPTTVGTWLGSFAQGWKDAAKMLDGATPDSDVVMCLLFHPTPFLDPKHVAPTVRKCPFAKSTWFWAILGHFGSTPTPGPRIGVLDQNPLGSAAGFGINGLQLDRQATAQEMGFGGVQSNPMWLRFARLQGVILGDFGDFVFGLFLLTICVVC